MEFKVVELLAMGSSKKKVANDLHKSIYTIETTTKNAYEKLEINKLSELVLWYCGVTFGIAKEIAEKRKEILPTIGLLICMALSSLSPEISMRRNNTRALQSQASEILCSRPKTRRREQLESDNERSTINPIWAA